MQSLYCHILTLQTLIQVLKDTEVHQSITQVCFSLNSSLDTTAMSDVVLIEKLIYSLKSSAVIPANQAPVWPPEANFISVLMAGDPPLGYMGTFGH